MELSVPLIPESKYRLICVASQLLGDRITVDVDIISCQGQHFKPVDCFSFGKEDIHPGGLMLVALGQKVDPSDIWEKYADSDRIFIFICEPVEEKEVKKVLEVNELGWLK